MFMPNKTLLLGFKTFLKGVKVTSWKDVNVKERLRVILELEQGGLFVVYHEKFGMDTAALPSLFPLTQAQNFAVHLLWNDVLKICNKNNLNCALPEIEGLTRNLAGLYRAIKIMAKHALWKGVMSGLDEENLNRVLPVVEGRTRKGTFGSRSSGENHHGRQKCCRIGNNIKRFKQRTSEWW